MMEVKQHIRRADLVDWNSIPEIEVTGSKDEITPFVYANQKIASGSVIPRGSYLLGCKIGDSVTVLENSYIVNSIFGDDATVETAEIGLKRWCSSTEFGKRAKIHRSDMTSVKFGDNSEVYHSRLGSHSKFGNDCIIDGCQAEGWVYTGDRLKASDTRFGHTFKTGDDSKFGIRSERDFGSVLCRFGHDAVFGQRSVFGDDTQFEGIPIFEEYRSPQKLTEEQKRMKRLMDSIREDREKMIPFKGPKFLGLPEFGKNCTVQLREGKDSFKTVPLSQYLNQLLDGKDAIDVLRFFS